MQRQMSPLPPLWARKILPALLCILPLLMFQYHYLFKIRLVEGQEKGSLLQYVECLTVAEVLHLYAL